MRMAVSLCASRRSALLAALRDGDASRADDAVEQLIEVGCELLSGVARPDVERLGGTLSLLQRRTLRQLRGEDEGPEHVAQLLDAELVLDRLRAHAVHDDAERLQSRREPAADLLDRTEGAVGRCHGEEARFGDDHDAVARRPRGSGQCIQRWRAVDEDEVVVGFDGSEGLLELPHIADTRVRTVEVDRRGTADEYIDGSGVHLRPAAGGDRLTDDLLLRVRQDVGDVETSGHLDVHPGGDVGLRVEVDDESPDSSGEGR